MWVNSRTASRAPSAGRVTGAVMIESADGKVFIPGDIGDRQTDAFLKEQITEWSFPGIPIPKAHGNKGAEVIGEILDGDDYTALHDAVQPLVVKVVGGNRGNSRSTPAELPQLVTVLRSRGKQGAFPEGFPPQMLKYRWWLKAYGLPPREVDELWEDEDFWIPVVEEAWAEVERLKAAEAQNQQQGGR